MIENLIHTLQSLKVGLKVVNGSLKINAPKGTLTPEIIDEIKKHKNGLIALLSTSDSIPVSAEKERYVLTSSQRRLWTLSQFDKGSVAYTIFNAFEFKGGLDIDSLSRAYIQLVDRHESLRTVFKEDASGELGQYIIPLDSYNGVLEFVDLNDASEEALKAESTAMQSHDFDLEAGPLFIGKVVRVSEDRHVLMFAMHHIIGDGWSMEILNKEFVFIYNGLSQGQEVVLPTLAIQYKDYAEWQDTEERRSILEQSQNFWLDIFSGELPVLELPSNNKRPKLKTYNGSNVYHRFSKEFSSLLNGYAQQRGMSLFMVLMGGLNGLLSRYANTRDIILGTPVAGRDHGDLEGQVGLFLNTLAIRTRFADASTFEELLSIQKSTLLEAYAHQEYPFDRLVEELSIKRDVSRSVLFDTLVVFQNQQDLLVSDELALEGLEISSYAHMEKTFNKFDLTFVFAESDDILHLNLGYNTDIYESDFIENIVGHIENFLTIGITTPTLSLDSIDFLLEKEKQELLVDFNQSQASYSKDKTVIDLFLDQVSTTPDGIALESDTTKITYKELDAISNQLANYITASFAISKGEIISIALEKSDWFVVSVLAVLKSGCTYLPIDTKYPEDRISYIRSHSDCKMTIDEGVLSSFRDAQEEYSQDFTAMSSEVAYVIYTSGSTGKPKGVMVGHDSLVNYISYQSNYYGVDNSDRILYFSNIAFDASIEQLFLALTGGGTLVLVNRESLMDVSTFSNVLRSSGITHLHATPGYISQIESLEDCSDVRRIVCAGEVCPKELADRLGSQVDFYNKYGPTETTISSTIYKYTPNQIGKTVPIGRPVANTEIYIVSEAMELQPCGVIGEICISGDGLSRGYLHQLDLTREKFVENRFGESKLMYKTGDLGRWLPDGNIEFVARKDDQVKIRGYRIELGEIENTLVSLSDINQGVVVVTKVAGEQVLVAYYTSDQELDKQALRLELSTILPDYMVPTYYVALESIALTANGKVDKKSLPAIAEADVIRNEYVAPKTTLEKQMVAIWEEVLGMDRIGLTDNFFELGGHSLKVTLIVNKIKNELGLSVSIKDVFLNPTITGITEVASSSNEMSIPRSEEKESYALTSSQRRLWALSQFEQGSIAYNIPAAFQLNGCVDVGLIKEAFDILIDRHESLRTRFMYDAQTEEVRQYIIPSGEVVFEVGEENLSNIKHQRRMIAGILRKNNRHCFDLSEAPLIKACLIKLAARGYILVLNMHHIISDGWSMEVLSKEFMLVYGSLVSGDTITLPELSIQYKDYAEWLGSESQEEALLASESYWLGQFEGELPVLELPTFKARPKLKTYNGAGLDYAFSKEVSAGLRTFSERRGASLFMTLMAGVNGLLSRYANTRDIIVGTPIAGRSDQALEHQIGLYLNTLAIRTQFEEGTTFEELLALEKHTLLDAYAHQGYPLDSLVDKLDVRHDTSRSGLFDVVVVLQNQQNLLGGRSIEVEGLDITPYTHEKHSISKFDMSFVFTEIEGQLAVHIDYNTDIYDPVFVEKIGIHLENFLNSCLQNADQSIADINFLTKEDTTQLLTEFNTTKKPYDINRTVIDVFVNQVNKTPDAIALVHEGKQFTYAALDTLSNQMAHYLLSNFELSKEDIVGIKLDRGEWLVISLLSVLKAGCAYVPIDPSYPEQRIEYIQVDSNCTITIDTSFIDAFNAVEHTLTSLPEIHISPSSLAYVIYTSGSTGKPKGVMIEHKSALNLSFWHIEAYHVTSSSRGTLYAGIGFDASVWEIYPYLLAGASLYPISDSEVRYDVQLLTEFLKQNEITHAYLPTKICEELVGQNISIERIKILTGGEALSLPKGALDVHIYNNYGPSENSVVTTNFDLRDRSGDSIPIGKPVSNTEIYIVSNTMQLQPVGVVGEICISGVGLSRGYLNRKELTEEKFVFNRFRESGLLYKTGDLGRWLPDGNIEFIGRKDSQVKIRGYRIELGEIENTLTSLAAINQAVIVVATVKETQALVAYYTSSKEINKQELRTELSNMLPDYMVPTYYVALDTIPLNANGKVDKKALPAIVAEDVIKNEYVAPSTDLERQLVAIWEEVLGIDPIGITDNFFELGGHSLKINMIVNKIKNELGLSVAIKDIFLNPTIAGITEVVEENTSDSIPVSAEKERYVLTSSQRRLWTLSQFDKGSVAYTIFNAFEFRGGLDIDSLSRAYIQLVDRHESLRTVFKEDTSGELGQYIIPLDSYSGVLEFVDLNDASEEALKAESTAMQSHDFDLEAGPLFIGKVVRVSEDRHVLMFAMHHIIGDGWSMEILNKEFVFIYNGLSQGQEVVLPTLAIQYKDYAEWQDTEERRSILEQSQNFWLDIFSGELPVLELPSNNKRPKLKTYNGSNVYHRFSKEFSSLLNGYAQQRGMSLFMVLMGGLNGLLSRYANTRDIILGTPVAGRDHGDLEGQVGLFLNTLAIRTRFADASTFEELLSIQKSTLLEAYAHQEYPFDRLVEELSIKRDVSRSVLFDTLVVFQNQQDLLVSDELALEGLEISSYAHMEKTFNKFDLTFVFAESDDILHLNLGYNTDIYESDFIENIVGHIENFLTIGITTPTLSLDSIDFLLEKEKQELLVDFNQSQASYSKDKTVIDLFLDQVSTTPDGIALESDTTKITYKELDAISNQLANYITASFAISKGEIISIALEKSDWFVVSVLAVLKSGCTYLPIDTKYPEDRISYIRSHSDCKMTIDESILSSFRDAQEEYSSDFTAMSSEVAYVIYTSGSTGKPKGVMVGHDSLVNYISYQSNYYGVDNSDRILYFSNIAFDASIEQLFLALTGGGTLVLVNRESLMDVSTFSNVLRSSGITHLHATPGYISQIESLEDCSDVRRIVCAGEVCPKELADRLGSQVDFYNKYGPTETTISSTIYKYTPNQIGKTVPIGRPVANTEIYIVSEAMELQPCGVIGEICISGDGLSRGYLHQLDLTREKFVENRFGESKLMYKTGDLGRWLPDGNIEFVARKDDQVKIRGYRIELGEIENTLVSLSDINQGVVVVTKVAGEQVLVAYYTSDQELDKQALRLELSTILPDYMVPTYYVALESIALTANGKVDKKSLPAIAEADVIRNEYVAPKTTLEKQMVAIWEEVLGMDRIGLTDNFFELGGHSLKVTLIVNKIKNELGLSVSIKDVFLNPTITGITEVASSSNEMSIPKSEEKESYALTSSQRRLWALSQFEQGSIAYNIPAAFQLNGCVDVGLIKKAFDVLIDRHESLRTRFMYDAQTEEVRQYIIPSGEVVFEVGEENLSNIKHQRRMIAGILRKNNRHCFDLSEAPLIKACLIKLAARGYILVLNMHHIISDGWSMEVLSKEFMLVYGSLVSGDTITLPELSIQYKDYAEWLGSESQEEALLASESYWLGQFEGELPVLELPTFKARPKLKTYNGAGLDYAFSKEVSAGLRTFSERRGASLFMTLMAGVNGLLSRYANTRDIIVGTPIAGRSDQALEHQIGLYLNTLAIRTQFEEGTTFEELLALEKHTLLDAYAHQGYPLDSLVDKLDVRHDTSRSGLFDVVVVLQNQQNLLGGRSIEVEGLDITPYTHEKHSISKFDMSFVFTEIEGQLAVHIDYNTDIYDPVFVEKIGIHLEAFMMKCITNPTYAIEKISYISTEEKSQLLNDFNQTEIAYPKDQTVIDLFVEQVAKTPDATALMFKDVTYTYAALDNVSTRLANYVLKHHDLTTEDLVGIKLDNSEWQIIAILAILKAGCAYVPIDTSYPEQRIAYMEEDCKCKLTIDEDTLEDFNNEIELSDTLPLVDTKPNHLAYVMYTSGSTGTPKGVMVEHKNIIRLVKSANFYQLSTQDILLSTGAFSFDATTFEYWGTLLNGGCLVICPKETLLDSEVLSQEIKNRNVNIMWFTAGWLQMLVDTALDLFAPLTTVLSGGDKLSPKHIAILKETYPELTIINGYGPTENTTFSITYEIPEVVGDIPIGYPISNSTAYILSDYLEVQPIGVIGEICLGGDGLSRGYLNHPELTAEKFVSDRFRESGILYKTGDLGRWLPDGTVEFMGRKDNQVKLRGYRIELGEIEAALLSYEEIPQAVVVIKEVNDTKEIVAYMVCESLVDKEQLRASLKTKLPDYMLPSYFVVLDEMPLTSNGKIATKLLPEVTEKDIVRKKYVAPSTALEIQLVEIWQHILGIETIGITDDFFELGGHSLKASKLLSDYQKFCNVKIEMQKIFSHTTIEAHCKLIENAQKVTYVAIPKTPIDTSYPVSNTQKKMWVASQYDKGSIAYNIPACLELSIDATHFKKAIDDVIRRHEILRTVFKQESNGDIRQYIVTPEAFEFEIKTLDYRKYENIEAHVRAYVINDLNKMFDLENGPLLRGALLQVSATNYVFYFNMHHIISDGWSIEVLTKDVLAYYEAYQKNTEVRLEQLNIQYKDYVSWYQNSKTTTDHKEYWTQHFSGEIPKMNLSISDERPAIKTFDGNSFSGEISKETFDKLKHKTETSGTSLYMSLMGVVNVLLYRYSYQNDIIIGSPFAGRDHPDLKDQIGCFINTIPIRSFVDENKIYDDFLEEVKQAVLEAQYHGSYPFDAILEDIKYSRDLSRSPLFDIMVVMIQNANKEHHVPLENPVLSNIKLPSSNSKVDITFFFKELDDKILCRLVYNTTIYSETVIEKLFESFMTILEKTLDDTSLPIKEYVNSTIDKTERIEYNSFIEELSNSISEDF